ncbi:MAG: molybdenum cofactor biosynthesis protein MoaB [Candidatus Binataceae bacterium]|nr:molybdenum cofactor biosynthesis protein MoaB [Candidatus Binataceae bacterium]
MAVHEHHKHDRTQVRVGIITLSDTRTPDTDESGRVIRDLVERAGHQVVHYEIVPDTPELIERAIVNGIELAGALILSGGTGIAPRDCTIEVVRPMLETELEGFGELFRMLSYQEIGPAAFLSRALAGVVKGKLVVALPGSPTACRLALEKLLLPELGHMAQLLNL